MRHNLGIRIFGGIWWTEMGENETWKVNGQAQWHQHCKHSLYSKQPFTRSQAWPVTSTIVAGPTFCFHCQSNKISLLHGRMMHIMSGQYQLIFLNSRAHQRTRWAPHQQWPLLMTPLFLPNNTYCNFTDIRISHGEGIKLGLICHILTTLQVKIWHLTIVVENPKQGLWDQPNTERLRMLHITVSKFLTQ